MDGDDNNDDNDVVLLFLYRACQQYETSVPTLPSSDGAAPSVPTTIGFTAPAPTHGPISPGPTACDLWKHTSPV